METSKMARAASISRPKSRFKGRIMSVEEAEHIIDKVMRENKALIRLLEKI
ncbi:MAG: hypothetical protein Q8P05_00865 [Candidatus Diapherotrites archaeon]|nr:hypothetical protein [Candidatus Diapherotrites archaeon]